jgi:hypothetical protein
MQSDRLFAKGLLSAGMISGETKASPKNHRDRIWKILHLLSASRGAAPGHCLRERADPSHSPQVLVPPDWPKTEASVSDVCRSGTCIAGTRLPTASSD